MSKSLYELCYEEHKKGFVYASFVDISKVDELKIKKVFELKNSHYKPNGIFFSKLENSLDENFEKNEKSMIPEWFSFINNDWDCQLDEYSKKAILFAKFNESKIGTFSYENLMPYTNLSQSKEIKNKNFSFNTLFDWDKYAKHEWNGIRAERKNFSGVCWDVNTVVVWNWNAISEMEMYEPFDNNFYYKLNNIMAKSQCDEY